MSDVLRRRSTKSAKAPYGKSPSKTEIGGWICSLYQMTDDHWTLADKIKSEDTSELERILNVRSPDYDYSDTVLSYLRYHKDSLKTLEAAACKCISLYGNKKRKEEEKEVTQVLEQVKAEYSTWKPDNRQLLFFYDNLSQAKKAEDTKESYHFLEYKTASEDVMKELISSTVARKYGNYGPRYNIKVYT